MEIAGFEFPDDLYYDKTHGWAKADGSDVEQGQTFMSMESGKWVGRVEAVVSGKIAEVNEELEWEPSTINESPFEDGWLVKIEASNVAELDNLMKAGSPEFKAFIEGEAEKYKDVLS
jgi:glycine cleavage system H protein